MTTADNSRSGKTRDSRFPRNSRLADAASFGRVFEQATRSRDNMFTVLSRSNKGRDARLGLAISKKHCRQAVTRNRVKRIVRESFRQHRHELRGLDIVVLNGPGAQAADNKTLFASLERHWQRSRALHPEEGR